MLIVYFFLLKYHDNFFTIDSNYEFDRQVFFVSSKPEVLR